MNLEDLTYPLLATYIASPQWVKRSVGGVWAALPPSVRWGRGYKHWFDLARERDPQRLKDIAREGLRKTLAEALANVPAYADFRHLAAQLDDPYAVLRQLPTVTKADIKRDLDRYASTRFKGRQRLVTFTGGSTSEPMRFYLQSGVTRTKEFGFMADFHSRVNLQPDDVLCALRGRTVPTAGEGGRQWMYEPIKRWLICSSDHLEARYMPQYIDAMRQWKPVVITANPSGAYPLAKWLKAHPDPEVTGRIKGVVLFGEHLYEHQRATLKEVFDCPVLNHYGHSERVLMAAALPEDDRLYFWPHYGHLELLDDAGNPITEPGVVGELVGTSFDNFAMPFVRYRTGDMGAWSAEPSRGPEGFPVIEKLEGRLQEFVVCRDQRLITVATLGAAHFSELANVGAIQYRQDRPGHLTLCVESATPLSPQAVKSAQEAIFAKTQGGCEATIEVLPHIPRTSRGKRSLLVQKLDLSAYLGASHEGGNT